MIPQMSAYIDIGVNLTGSSFSNDLDQVIQRAIDASVCSMIVTGTSVEHSRAAIELCRRYPDHLYATVGVHPHHADDYAVDTAVLLEELSRYAPVVAIGECGLDYNRNYSTSDSQRRAFESQLELAEKVKLPVFLHQRDAHQDFIAMLAEHRSSLVDAVAHCFAGTAAEVGDYLQMDMYIGITGWICDERRGRDLQQAVKEIPLDRLLLETDAPYLLPRDLPVKPVSSRRNEPCFLPHIAATLAACMGIEVAELEQAVLENSRRLFRINVPAY